MNWMALQPVGLTGNSPLFNRNTLVLFVIAIPTCQEKRSIREFSKMDYHVAALLSMNTQHLSGIPHCRNRNLPVLSAANQNSVIASPDLWGRGDPSSQASLMLHGLPRRSASRNDGIQSPTPSSTSSRVPTSGGVAIHLHGLR